MNPDVSIVIVTYNSANHITACLDSVHRESGGLAQEVVVVDNASRDGTADLVRRRFPDVRLVEPGENLGFARGVNLGAGLAHGAHVLLLNPDTVVLDHAIPRVLAFAGKHPEHGIYGGRTLKPDGSLEPSSCWGTPSLWSMSLFALGLTTLAPRNRFLDPESLGRWQRDSVREVGVVTGCFLLARRDVWETLGGLDERYFMYGEDVDFSMRARAAGYRPVLCPDACLIHEVGQCSRTPVHKTLLLYRGKASLVRTHWRGARRALGLGMLAAGTGLRAAVSRLLDLIRPRESSRRWLTLWAKRREWMAGYDAVTPRTSRGHAS